MTALRRVGLLAALALLAGICTPAHAATVNETYGPEPDQYMQITTLSGSGHPWVMVVHGGSWAAGSTLNGVRAQQVFTAAGFVVFNTEYRKITDYPGRPGVPWAAQRDDIVNALDWVHAHADEYGADPDRGAIYGFSAGGHLAASAGLYGDGLSRVRAIVSASGVLQPQRLVQTTAAQWAAVAMRCPNVAWTGCSTRWKDFEPETHISGGDPPIWMTQGTADPGVPPETARAFRTVMQAHGLEAVLVECINWGHTESCALDGGWRQQKLLAWLTARTA